MTDTTSSATTTGGDTLLDKIKAAYEKVKTAIGRELGDGDLPKLVEELTNPTGGIENESPIETAIHGAIKSVEGRFGRIFDDNIVGEVIKAVAEAIAVLPK